MSGGALPGRLRPSAHLGYLFDKLPIDRRFAAAREAGFRAIEIPDPYSMSPTDFRALCDSNELEVAQIALPNGPSGGARKGLAALPGRHADFDAALANALTFAKAVNCRSIHPMAGAAAPFEPAPDWDIYLSNLDKACAAAAGEDLRVIIEPISTFGARNYFMSSLRLAFRAIEQVGATNLFLSIDTYHAAAMGAHLPLLIARQKGRIGHVQLADWPGRGEPGSGGIDFKTLFAALHEVGYSDHVGLEYQQSPDCGFAWLASFDSYLEPLRPAEDLANGSC